MDYKCVYSLWTAPSGDIRNKALNWVSPKAHLYSWVLSVNTSAKHFKEVELVTDELGKKILIDELKLPFTSVKVVLDEYIEYKDFWAFGKIIAYMIQDKPFIHLDADAFLWKGLPEKLKGADVFTQNIEDEDWFKSAYLGEIKHIENKKNFYKVESWGMANYANCCGIFGGSNISLIKAYTKEVLNFIKQNKKAFKDITNKGSYCIVFEQYILACVCEILNVEMTYLERNIDKEALAKHSYTHIWGEKKDITLEKTLENIIKKEFNSQYKKIKYGI